MAREVRSINDLQVGAVLFIEARANTNFITGAYLIDALSPPDMIALKPYLPDLKTDSPFHIYNLDGLFDQPSAHRLFGKVQIMEIPPESAPVTGFVMGKLPGE